MQTVDTPNWCNDTLMWRPPFGQFVSSAFCPGSSSARLPQGDNQQFRPSHQAFCGRGNVPPVYARAFPVSIPPAYSLRSPTLLQHPGIHRPFSPVAQRYQQPNMFMSKRTFLPTPPMSPPPVQMPNLLSPSPRSIPSRQPSVFGKKPCNQGISQPLPQRHQNPNMVTNQRPFLRTPPMGPPQPLMSNILPSPPRRMYAPVPQSSAWKMGSARSKKPQAQWKPCLGQRSSSPLTLQRRTGHHRDYMDKDTGKKQRVGDSSKSRGPLCYSPPPPDVERVMKHIIPEALYSKSSKDEDIAQIIYGTEGLKELHQKFEKEILNMEPILDQGSSSEEDISSTKGENGMDDFHCRHERDDGSAVSSSVLTSDSDEDSDTDSTEEGSQALGDSSDSCDIDNDDDDNNNGNNDDDDDDDDDDGDAEEEHFNKGPSVEEVHKRKIKHPQRLHPELWFNERGETNDGPICRCSTVDKKQGICHGIYPGEKAIPKCDPLSNNADLLHHYWVTVTPHTNFMTENPTVIKVDGKDYTFEGFSLFCHQPLQEVPACSVIRFNIEYFLHLVKEPIPQNFCVQDLELFSQFLFQKVLELSDWDLNGNVPHACTQYHFMPRFVHRDPDEDESKEEQHKLLSMNYVLSHVMDSAQPLIKPHHFCLPFDEWREYVKSCVNSIVIRPDKKPAALRVDDLKFYEGSDELNNKKDYPFIVHHGIRPVRMSFAGDPKYQKLWKSYIKLRNFVSNTAVPRRKHQDKLIQLKVELATMRMASSMRRDVLVEVSSRGMIKSGLKSDVCQHALLLPVLVHHLRYHRCLQTLDTNIGYVFTDRSLMQLALTHPSYHLNFGMNPDHARNSLSNCGVKEPRYGDRKIRHLHTRKKGITQLIRVMSNLGKMEEHQSMIRHNERLEYLGDAVLELICSAHLYFMFPSKSEGSLAMYRSALVQNKNLAQLAKKLELSAYMQYAHGPDLCMVEDLNHAMANCFEALLGAVFLESGLESATDLFTKLAFEDEELREVWTNLPKHPLQAQQPGGDRHLISSSALLQKLVEFEKASGIEFSHIRLLARAFTHPQVGFNNLTLGSNQRMEFLGDSLLKFVVSEYLFKHFPNHHEGHLTLLRSSLVNHRIQADITRDLGLNGLINFGTKGLTAYREKLLADVLEAFIAALYVDKGLQHVKVFCRVCLFSRLEDLIINQDWIDAKSQLQQCCLTSREEGKPPDVLQYKVLQNKGPAHHKRYTVAVYWKGKRLGSGEGKSRRQAEMLAAKDALSSRYFPEIARQKHLLDRKHKWRRRNHWNKEPRKPSENKTKEDIGFEVCWEEKDIFEENEQKRKLEGEEDFPKESKILKPASEVSDSNV